jgi:hypothetical protein
MDMTFHDAYGQYETGVNKLLDFTNIEVPEE